MANSDHWTRFVWADWRSDPDLNRCSKAAKGVWIDALAVAFECEDSGVFETGGSPWPLKDIAAAIPGDTQENLQCLEELVEKGVLSCSRGGAYFSKRMVADSTLRRARSLAGSKGGSKRQANIVANLSNSNSCLDSSSGGGSGEPPADSAPPLRPGCADSGRWPVNITDAILRCYPAHRRGRPLAARQAIALALDAIHGRAGVDDAFDWLLKRTQEYAKSPEATGKYAPSAARWFGEGGYDQDTSDWKNTNGKPAIDMTKVMAIADSVGRKH